MSSSISLRTVDSQAECLACFAVMRELRPHLQDAQAFVEQIGRQAVQGYRLLAAWRGDEVVALAGYRLQENTLYGRFVYLDDLVTCASEQRSGIGQQLIEAVRDEALRAGCAHLVLDTGLGNALAQRFYFRNGLLARGMHFAQSLQEIGA